MARNTGTGGSRRGAIRNRSQFRLPSGHYAKRDTRTGLVISVKADRKPWKGVVIEKHPPASMPTSPHTIPSPKRVNLPSISPRPVWHSRPGRQEQRAERA
jgi:hypothetical protein